jgi:uncharacterized membrane protein (Fun14 family)
MTPPARRRPTAREWAARSLPREPPAASLAAAAALEAGDGGGGEAGAVRAVGEQLGVGGLLGLSAGYAARRLGRAAAFAVGSEVLLLQYLAHRGWVTVHWRTIGEELRPKVRGGVYGAVREVVLYRLPFASAFSVGMAAGLRL